MKLTFLGGVGTVTGSKYLVETGGTRVLVDCGLFQGFKQLRLRNWQPLPIDPRTLDAVVLTHAHLDHSGYVPRLVRSGFSGPVFCSSGTKDLCEILLRDSGYLFEKDANYANRHEFSKHHPALPLYTQKEADTALKQFQPCSFGQEVRLPGNRTLTFVPGGHILGAAIVRLTTTEGASLVFSGDLGRPDSPTMLDPTAIARADYLVVESTYGNRLHEREKPEDVLTDIITQTAARGGTILIPAFAVGRAQSLLYYLHKIKSEGRIPDLPIFLDSPMAINASNILCAHLEDQRLPEAECRAACAVATYTRDVEQSKTLNENNFPKIIISASGMATGGRVLHHLKHYAPNSRNTILFTGFQAGGTRGEAMVSGAQQVKIHGQYIPVRAEVKILKMLSAHADADEILGWLRKFETPPRETFITHGEPAASDALRHRIEEELKWRCRVPEHLEAVELG